MKPLVVSGKFIRISLRTREKILPREGWKESKAWDNLRREWNDIYFIHTEGYDMNLSGNSLQVTIRGEELVDPLREMLCGVHGYLIEVTCGERHTSRDYKELVDLNPLPELKENENIMKVVKVGWKDEYSWEVCSEISRCKAPFFGMSDAITILHKTTVTGPEYGETSELFGEIKKMIECARSL